MGGHDRGVAKDPQSIEKGVRRTKCYNTSIILKQRQENVGEGVADVEWGSEVESELAELPVGEQVAARAVIEKLVVLGDRLPYPHQSAIQGMGGLRELRPRQGRSRWRLFYKRTGLNIFTIGAVGPEASVSPRGFQRSVALAEERLSSEEST